MKDKLKELQKQYMIVNELEKTLRKQYIGKKIKIDKEYDAYEDCFDFKIDWIDVVADDIEFLYNFTEVDGEVVECVDNIFFEDFIKYVEIID